ncbi:CRISPR-associated endonuclease Cas2 [Rosettibacter firmus]|uniref:CRISPR-associated endonuclease Cas2 n=1 Tax=Rosettibacter firmus TaxID=3111522 RepID=UPI00336C2CA4
MNHIEPVNKVFYIAVYDIASNKRLQKVLNTLRKYMNWVQNSAFEGELTAKQFHSLKEELNQIINKEKDSIIFYHAEEQKYIGKKILGIEKNEITQFY